MKLTDIPSRGPEELDKKQIKKENKQNIKRIAELQRVLYAEEKQSLLIILQGLDASGKDGTIRSIFSRVNPLGCQVKAFKKPTPVEFAHDFLWRVHEACPAKGMIQIFNRSQYEDILVPSVEGYLPQEMLAARYDQINQFEEHLQSCGTHILKFYMHVSYEEQHRRLVERTQNPQKYWKHSDGDWSVREKWDKYIEVYERIFEKCNHVPWHIVPCDRNWVKINAISKTILNSLEGMELEWPNLDSDLFAKN